MLKWFVDPAFWRDITRNVVSAGIVGLLAYLGAVLGGYIDSPRTRVGTIFVLTYVPLFLLTMYLVHRVSLKREWHSPGERVGAVVIWGFLLFMFPVYGILIFGGAFTR